MKKQKLLMIMVAIIGWSTAAMAQPVPGYVPTNGLVGWWPFNGNANDESGNGNNGTVNGATLTTDRFGQQSHAYSFDGTSNYIETNISQSLSFSVSAWFNPAVSTSGILGVFQHKDTCSRGGGYIFETENNSIRFQAINCGQCGNVCPNSFDYNNLMTVNVGQWYHIVITCDGVSTYQVFINGQLVQLITSSSTLSQYPVPFSIGKHHDIPDLYFFNGKIDDIGYWNRALTQQEITNLYNASTPPPCNPLPGNLMNGLVGYWPFCGNANDESGNGNNGTVNGAILSPDRFGMANSSYLFDRNSLEYINVSNSSNLNNITNTTISFWFKIYSYGEVGASGYNHFINKSDQNNQHQFIVANNFTGLYFYYGGGNSFFQTNTLPPLNQWNNLVITYNYDGTLLNSKCKFYLNGALTDSFVTTASLPITNFDLRFGSFGTPSYDRVDGNMDDICIWNRALSTQEINQLSNQNLCYQTITVTDTLLINVHLTGLNPVTYQNTIRVYPNPAGDHVTIDFGSNYSSLSGYSIRIDNTVGQTVYSSPVQQQPSYIDLNSWSGVGLYFIYLLDNQGHVVDVRKIVLQ